MRSTIVWLVTVALGALIIFFYYIASDLGAEADRTSRLLVLERLGNYAIRAERGTLDGSTPGVSILVDLSASFQRNGAIDCKDSDAELSNSQNDSRGSVAIVNDSSIINGYLIYKGLAVSFDFLNNSMNLTDIFGKKFYYKHIDNLLFEMDLTKQFERLFQGQRLKFKTQECDSYSITKITGFSKAE